MKKFHVEFPDAEHPLMAVIEAIEADDFDSGDGLIRFYNLTPWPPGTKTIPYEGSTHFRQYHSFFPMSRIRAVKLVAP